MRKRRLSVVVFLVLFMLPMLVQGFDIDRDLGASASYAIYQESSEGWRIEGTFSSSEVIEFFICDEGNYTRWTRNQVISSYEYNEESLGQTFNFTIPYDSVWYVVFSNIRSQNTNSLEAELYFIDLSDIVQTEIGWISHSTILTPAMIGFLIAVPALCLLGVWMSRRSEQFPAVKYDKILPKPE